MAGTQGRKAIGNGRYELLRVLGKGGMATAYLARDVSVGRMVVVKVPRRDLFRDASEIDRFVRELRTLASLSHPHIVRILDAGAEGKVPYYVMEYFEGGTLASRMVGPDGQPRRFSPQVVYDWLAPIADALDFIHSQGVVHRDVKPANVLFDKGGNTYLADFGLARAMPSRAGGTMSTVTAAGLLLGTPRYVAPEIVQGKAYDGRADQYSLAVTAYELLAGRPPFEGVNSSAIMVAHVNEAPPLLRTLGIAVPTRVDEVLMRALEKDPDHRFPSCRVFMQEFYAAFLYDEPTLAATASEPLVRRRRKRRLWGEWYVWAAGGAAAAVIATVLGSTFFSWRGVPADLTAEADPVVAEAPPPAAVSESQQEPEDSPGDEQLDGDDASQQAGTNRDRLLQPDLRAQAMRLLELVPRRLQQALNRPSLQGAPAAVSHLPRVTGLRWVATLAAAAVAVPQTQRELSELTRRIDQGLAMRPGTSSRFGLLSDPEANEVRQLGAALHSQLELLRGASLAAPRSLEDIEDAFGQLDKAVNQLLLTDLLRTEEATLYADAVLKVEQEVAALRPIARSALARILLHQKMVCGRLAAAARVLAPESGVQELTQQADSRLARANNVVDQLETLTLLEIHLWEALAKER